MNDWEQQQALALALELLSLRITLLENQLQDLSLELPTLERDDEMLQVDQQLMHLKKDYERFASHVDPNFKKETYDEKF
ncbi:MAG: hypothetical protein LBI43_03225 [Streptococcaceae bacterium]|jgi:hypothetical protein|nr:hypothetical protein [Streptococcaceae bacterium]